MPPIHPDFVHFAIALVTVAFFADLLGFTRHRPGALRVAWVCLLLGLLGTAAAILTGVWDMHRAMLHEDTDRLADLHMRIGFVFGAALLVLTIWRGWIRQAGPGARRSAPYLICFALVLGLLSFQGWFGGELAYAHGAGVAAAGQGMVPTAQARARLDRVAGPLLKLPVIGDSGEEEHADAERSSRR